MNKFDTLIEGAVTEGSEKLDKNVKGLNDMLAKYGLNKGYEAEHDDAGYWLSSIGSKFELVHKFNKVEDVFTVIKFMAHVKK